MRTTILALSAVASLAAASPSFATSYAMPDPRDMEFEQSYVTRPVAVRAGPGQRQRIVNSLERGDFVNVGDCLGTWCYVDVYGGNGWVEGRHIGRGENPYHSRAPMPYR